MADQKLDAVLLFAQESMYWLTGYDTFGFCFFQCLVVTADGRKVLLTRSADQRQARHTSNISDIRIWIDLPDASPVGQLKDLLFGMDLLGAKIGIEYDTHGMTGKIGIEINAELSEVDARRFVLRLGGMSLSSKATLVGKLAAGSEDWIEP